MSKPPVVADAIEDVACVLDVGKRERLRDAGLVQALERLHPHRERVARPVADRHLGADAHRLTLRDDQLDSRPFVPAGHETETAITSARPPLSSCAVSANSTSTVGCTRDDLRRRSARSSRD